MRVATGVYRDRHDNSWEIFVRVKGQPLAHRHHPSTLTRLEAIDKRSELRSELKRLKPTTEAPAEPGTLAADVVVFLSLLDGNPRLKAERTSQLAFWVHRFGDRPRSSITRIEIQQVLASWAADGYAYYTIKHRRGGLLALYQALDKGKVNPVAETSIPVAKPEPEPRGLPLAVAVEILSHVSSQGGVVGKGDRSKPHGERGGRNEASKTQARIYVMAFTGMRHSELKLYQANDLRLATHELVIHGTKGSNERVVPTTPDAEYWLQELERRDAIGIFNNGVVNRAFRRALSKAGYAPPLPKGTWSRSLPKRRRGAVPGVRKDHHRRPRGRTGLIRPYDLRHTFGTAIYQQTGDLTVTQYLLGHKDIRQTQRYAKNAVAQVQRTAVAKFSAALDEARSAAKLPAEVTDLATHRQTGS